MAAKWTEEEKQVLLDVSKNAINLLSQMHRLPSRTYEGAKCYASKHGIPLTAADAWSNEERATLRRIWRGKESLKRALDRLLPRRSYSSARSEAQRLGLTAASSRGRKGRTGYSWLLPSIKRVLRAHGEPMTVKELAEATGANLRSVGQLLKQYHGKKFRIGGWARSLGKWAAQWEVGTKADEPKPAPKTREEVARAYRARRRIRNCGSFNPFASLVEQVAA